MKGTAVKYARDDDSTPHSELLIEAGGVKYRVAINVRSSRGPQHKRLIEYLIVDDFTHVALDHAAELHAGWNDLVDATASGASLDYIRSNMFRPTDMKPLVHDKPGPNNDLFERVEDLLQRAIDDTRATVYAFGEPWGPENDKEDQYFHFKPGNGVHQIHMNQGNGGEPNAKFQDGALMVTFANGSASALFLKFQNQSWHTDEETADPIAGAPTPEPLPIPDNGVIPTWDPVAPNSPFRLARIVGALVNPAGHDAGKETVTIFNVSDKILNLEGWTILDTQDRKEALSGSLGVGQARSIVLGGDRALLGNKGGTITLLDANGLKVDGVSYSKKDASASGRAITF